LKECTKCQTLKETTDFYTNPNNKDRLQSHCKICQNIKKAEIYLKNKDQYKIKQKEWKVSNKEKHLEYMKDWRKSNPDKARQFTKDWISKNRDYFNSKVRQAHAKRSGDVQFKLKNRLRSRISNFLKGSSKGGSHIKDLGCSVSDLKFYLESKFQEGMSWDNWSLHGWHIDHIKPLSKFDLTKPEEFKRACHYTNLQPLWAIDNLKKSDKYFSWDE